MTRAQVAETVGALAEFASNVLPDQWGAWADAVGMVADATAREIEMSELIKGSER
ncbi:hypothetical protein AB0O47_39900 [Streptomyces noursei]|uniref:hypothetical protein n=1 Tax=Streptomyces noursei TaxID=1971 RepID=UPI003450AAD9